MLYCGVRSRPRPVMSSMAINGLAVEEVGVVGMAEARVGEKAVGGENQR